MTNLNGIRTIVAATDFSEDAACAAAWAKEIARQHGARLVLVHAFVAEAVPAPEFVPLPPQYYEEIHGEARRHLDEEAAGLRSGGIAVETDLVLSSPVLGIADAARRHHADLIVAGTRGRTGWKRALLGSTAARLLREAPCPVPTVHRQDNGHPRPVRTVLVPTDFSEDAALAADAASRFLGAAGTDHRLVLLHAYRVPVEAMHLPANVLMEAIRTTADAARTTLQELAAKLRRPGLTVEPTTRQGYPPDVIVEHAATAGADLIAMGTHGRSGLGRVLLGSTAERVVATAPCPVLTVRRTNGGAA
ncbi:universal stress protein [Reyranella sp.]|uniref:universal stress protein n=1 Tax=Reyranella sp. TaxID=1929291 RepID=UPI003BAA09E1